MKLILTAFILIYAISSYSQNKEVVFLSKNDTTQNFYTVLKPDSSSKGLLIILGGFCTTPNEIMIETSLPYEACNAGYTVVMPYFLNDCDSIDKRNIYIKELSILIPKLIEKYEIPNQKLILGGHSLGGLRALYYTEMAYKHNDSSYLKPNLVFGVDPPLNLKRLWYSFEYGVKIKFSEVSVNEGSEMMRRFKVMYGGSPKQQPKKYKEMSAFYPEAKDGGNAKYLKNVPVRLYCDPDINWVIENRRGSYETMNATDLSGCISMLKLLGNKNAEFVNCIGKGFKPDGTRHPHYFSMLDTKEFINWVEKNLYSQ